LPSAISDFLNGAKDAGCNKFPLEKYFFGKSAAMKKGSQNVRKKD
jgi:hypothetical protein